MSIQPDINQIPREKVNDLMNQLITDEVIKRAQALTNQILNEKDMQWIVRKRKAKVDFVCNKKLSNECCSERALPYKMCVNCHKVYQHKYYNWYKPTKKKVTTNA